METSNGVLGRDWNRGDALVGVLLVAGIGLAGLGSYYHFKIAAMVRTTHCDGCAPWHPMIVTSIVVGSVFVVAAASLLYRRWGRPVS